MNRLGVIAIGRNEGQRLVQCLESLRQHLSAEVPIVYVDSGSTDHSVQEARQRGVEVVDLDLSTPFTAARARNTGFERLMAIAPDLEFVQFIDGDCAIAEGWIARAVDVLDHQPSVAVVCGRRREQHPTQSIYNQICDVEWDTPVGEADACGGDSLMRVEAFKQVDGFRQSLIAGEEPELCVRLRQQGWKVLRIDADMTYHDARMFHLSQWWKRSRRAGYAYAEGSWLHGSSPQRHWVRESRRIWLWGLAIPLLSLALAPLTHGFSLLLLLVYGVSAYRSYRHTRQRGFSAKVAWLYALSCVAGRFPEVQGQLSYHINRLLGRRQSIIEYKS
ncbi:MAG: glycosyltransferase family 2 protein [Elainellaceae cyanobacterium]